MSNSKLQEVTEMKLTPIATFLILSLTCILIQIPASVFAQQDAIKWSFRSSLLVTGSSDQSEPEGYKIFSAFTVETAIGYFVKPNLLVEFGVNTASHEIEFTDASGHNTNLGSVELLPLNILLRYYLSTENKFQPYVGGGANFTVCWEKSGELNSRDLTPSFGPAIQLGTDWILNRYIVANFDLKWNWMKTEIKDQSQKIAELKFHPLSLTIGLGFKF